MRGRPVERDQVGEPVDLVDEGRAELAACRDDAAAAGPATGAGRASGSDDPRHDEEASQREPERHVEQRPEPSPANSVTSPATIGGSTTRT